MFQKKERNLTTEFCRVYTALFRQTESQISGIALEARHLFTQKLFNRLLFLVFLGHKAALQTLWKTHQQAKQTKPKLNFYQNCLKPLFFAKSVEWGISEFFAQDANDRNLQIIVPDPPLTAIFEELFLPFRFTAQENSLSETQAALDPEVLSKVFEESVTGRHASGSYYTPRSIVTFMCREALKGYLATQCPTEMPETLRQFVDERNSSNLAAPEKVLFALKTVRVCDLACGGGAFLLGMLQELLALRQALFIRQQTSFEAKLEIIQQNLYGVDSDSFALNITRMRLWLALTADSNPFPPFSSTNLTQKIVQGDSLDSQLFDWSSTFSEVFPANFAEKRGFDLILANPPYVRHELLKNRKALLKKAFPEVYTSTADLYCYFYARAMQLLHEKGILACLSSNKWLRANYGVKLRQQIAAKCTILSLTDFAGIPLFSAMIDTAILIAQRGKRAKEPVFTQVKRFASTDFDLSRIIQAQGQTLPTTAFQGSSWNLTNAKMLSVIQTMKQASIPLKQYALEIYRGITTGCNRAFYLDQAKYEEILAQDAKSAEIIKPLVLGREIRKWHVVSQTKWVIFTQHGIDLAAYPAIKAHLAQWQMQLEPKPKAWSPDKPWAGRKAGLYKWYEIQDKTAYSALFAQPKIIFPDITKEARFTLEATGSYIDATAFIIPGKDLFLLGVLNSHAVWNYLKATTAILGAAEGGGLRLKRIYMQHLPIPKASPAAQQRIATLVQRCLDEQGKGPEVVAWEKEIDERVVELYGLKGLAFERERE